MPLRSVAPLAAGGILYHTKVLQSYRAYRGSALRVRAGGQTLPVPCNPPPGTPASWTFIAECPPSGCTPRAQRRALPTVHGAFCGRRIALRTACALLSLTTILNTGRCSLYIAAPLEGLGTNGVVFGPWAVYGHTEGL